MELANKTVVITGGSDGLGFALAKQFLHKGTRVCIIGRNQNKVDDAVKVLSDSAPGSQINGFTADVRNLGELNEVAANIGTTDILINNAGVWLEGSLAQNSEQEISNAIDINLKGVIYTTKAFLPQLEKSQEAHIINVSSTSGLRGRANQAIYVASKYGVTGFTDSLKADLEKTNIKVSGFYPGGMRTGLFEKAGNHKEHSDWMDAGAVAEVITFMIERDASMVMDHVVVNKRNARVAMP